MHSQLISVAWAFIVGSIVLLLFLSLFNLFKVERNIDRFKPGWNPNIDHESYKKHEQIEKKKKREKKTTALIIIVSSTIIGLIFYMILGVWWLAIIGSLLGLLVPSALNKKRIRNNTNLLKEQVEEACEIMAAVLNSGGGMISALERAAMDIGEPLKNKLIKTASQIRLGVPQDKAFSDFVNEVGVPELLIVSIGIELQQQGMAVSIPKMLEQTQKDIRDNQDFVREVRVLTSQNKSSGYIVSAMPFVLLLLMRMMAYELIEPLFTTPLGIGTLIGSIIFIIIGVYWLTEIANSIED